jgi:putative ABC transport system permease protein
MDALRDIVFTAARVHADILRQDLHYTARTLARTPGFAATAVLITAIGIGATTAVFSITDRVFLRPLPFREADALVKLWQRLPQFARMELSPPNYRDWRAMSTSFASMGAYMDTQVNLIGQGDPQRLAATLVTSDVFATLDAQPWLGRTFAAGDDRTGAAETVVLAYGLWQSVFAGDPAIVGRTIRLSDRVATVIGVMPEQFYFPDRETELWLPFRLDTNTDRTDNSLDVIARLKPGVSLAAARAELTTIAAQLERAYPKENEQTSAAVYTLREEISGNARLLLIALFGASLCVLLIACMNLANLLLTRFLGRRHELTVRAAIGAGRERLVRQLLTEALALSFVGGVLGIGLAVAAVPLLAQLAPSAVPVADAEAFDLRVLTFAVTLTLLTGLAFGVLPALRVCHGADASALRERASQGFGRRGERLRGMLVLAEISASIVLLVVAGLLIRAMWRVQTVDPGFRTDNVLTLRTALPLTRYAMTATRTRFYDGVLQEVRALPGVAGAGYITGLPMTMRGGIWPVNIKGRPEVVTRGGSDSASLRFVTPGFFAALAIPIRSGRDVSESDTRASPPVAVVSESFAAKYWPGDNPLGRAFTFASVERTVVGVVGDVRVRGLEQDSEPQVYLPYRQAADRSMLGYTPKDLVVKSTADPRTSVAAIRAIVRNFDPELPVTDVRLLADIVEGETAPRLTQVRVLAVFVVIAVLLAAIGIHGLLSFGVSRRQSEIGVRVALGAQRTDVLRMILREGIVLAAAGCAIGMALAYAAGRGIEALLAGIGPGDAITFVMAGGLAGAMTIAGSIVPARRALRVDPVAALRTE